MTKRDILIALGSRDKDQVDLFRYARKMRDKVHGRQVEVRSVIEYSNICRQACCYCGMNAVSPVHRYILSDAQVLRCVDRLYRAGRRVIMFQTGEFDARPYLKKLLRLLAAVKKEHRDLTLIGSFGSLAVDEYKKMRDIGVERYILKFETSDAKLYKRIKPSDSLANRLSRIHSLKKLGFHVSSGNITGLPGQSLGSVADDLLLLKQLDIPMGSTSVFIPNDFSDYISYPAGDINLALNFTAVLRILCPAMLIPTTSSLELVEKNGQYLGFRAGANVATLHDGTPKSHRRNFIIYKKDRYEPTTRLLKIIKKLRLIPVPEISL